MEDLVQGSRRAEPWRVRRGGGKGFLESRKILASRISDKCVCHVLAVRFPDIALHCCSSRGWGRPRACDGTARGHTAVTEQVVFDGQGPMTRHQHQTVSQPTYYQEEISGKREFERLVRVNGGAADAPG